QRYTEAHHAPASLQSAAPDTVDSADWQQTLADIEAQSGVSIPQAPDENKLAVLLDAAKSPSITDTVARTLFISLSSASSQGLGSDFPTQDQLIAQALSQL